jgi:NADPH:quinone reductase-like Zn-dependent oxidoreductase
MKAIVFERYGPPEVLQIKEVARPVPRDNEVLVKVHATSVTLYDCWCRSGTAPPGFGLLMRIASGIGKPKKPILGTELAGEIEEVGKDVKLFKKGDRVFGYPGMNLGAYVEYICLPEAAVAMKPASATYEQAAAALQGGLTALYFLRKGNIRSGQKVLVFGASGGIGIAAVQLARYFGAEVTGVCSTAKLDFVKSLGADRVIDYTREDFTGSGQTCDIILDTIGRSPVSGCKKLLKNNGFYLLTTFGLPKLVQLLWLSMTSNRKLVMGTLKEKTEDMVFLKELIEAGKLKIIIDRTYPVEEATEVHRYVESGQKKGNVVITLKHDNKT